MANGVFLTPGGLIYNAGTAGDANDSTLVSASTELLAAAPTGRGAAAAETTVKGSASESRKSHNMNH